MVGALVQTVPREKDLVPVPASVSENSSGGPGSAFGPVALSALMPTGHVRRGQISVW